MRASKGRSATLRNVLKRYQRVRYMMERGEWVDGQSVFGLPKIKQVKVKARKVVKEDKEATAESPAGAKSDAASPST